MVRLRRRFDTELKRLTKLKKNFRLIFPFQKKEKEKEKERLL